MSMALRTIRSRVSSCSEAGAAGAAGCAGVFAAGDGRVRGAAAGVSGVLVATTVPIRGRASTRPSRRRVVRALVAVASATPHSEAICRVEGTRSPGASSPSAMRRRIAATMRR